MEVSFQTQAPVDLWAGKEPLLSIVYRDGWSRAAFDALANNKIPGSAKN
jgi:hypothetical protein